MMSIPNPVGKRRRIPLTPLIDVIFILIMFFLLSSSFGVWRPLDILLGNAQTMTPEQAKGPADVPSVFIVMRQRPGAEEPTLNVNGADIAFEDLSRELDRLAGLGAETAVFVPARGAEFQDVVTILDEARTSRLRKISLHLGR